MRLMAANVSRFPFDRIVTHRMPLERAQEAWSWRRPTPHEGSNFSKWCALMAKTPCRRHRLRPDRAGDAPALLRELSDLYEIAALCDVSEEVRTACARDYASPTLSPTGAT